MDLNNKRVLLIAPDYFGYEKKIQKSLENNGATVDYFPEKISSALYGFCQNYAKSYAKKIEKNHLEWILENISKEYDIFFLIRGEIVTVEFIQELKNRFKDAQFVMYQWDSKLNNPNFLTYMHYFDKVSTFDRVDAKELNLTYLPLFYIDDYKNLELKDKREYDFVFFGSYHGDRLEVLKEVLEEANRLNLNVKAYLYINKLKFLRLLVYRELRLGDIKYLSIKKMTQKSIIDYYKNSYSVLDIESQTQRGLTMRTFEVLGAGLKLITTNQNISSEPFYDTKYIGILDRKSAKLDKCFFQRATHSNKKVMKEYTLNHWLMNIFKTERVLEFV